MLRTLLRAPRRQLALLLKGLRNQWALRRAQAGSALLVHYTPDLSGGAATWIGCCADALPELTHLVVSNRGADRKVRRAILGTRENIELVEATLTPQTLGRFLGLRPVAFFNHLYWDLQPVNREWLPQDRPHVISFVHAREALNGLDVKHADKVVLFSRHLEDPELEQRFSPEQHSNIVVLPNCMNEAPFATLPLQGSRRAGRFVVGNLTNGAPWKHAADFLDLCRDFARPDVHFRFLGAKDLLSLPHADLPLEIIPPFAEPAASYLGSVSVLVHRTASSCVETWGRVVTEAMFAGVPVVAERKGGIRDQLIHGETGFLCGTRAEFTACLDALHTNEDLYHRVAARAREHALLHFSLRSGRRDLLGLLSRPA
jgi:glycosyltransferase involved in cell wall biosynthesis